MLIKKKMRITLYLSLMTSLIMTTGEAFNLNLPDATTFLPQTGFDEALIGQIVQTLMLAIDHIFPLDDEP